MQTKVLWWSTVGPGQSGLDIQGEIEGTWPDKAPGLACSCKTGACLPPALRPALPRLGQEAGRTMGASGGGPALGGGAWNPTNPLREAWLLPAVQNREGAQFSIHRVRVLILAPQVIMRSESDSQHHAEHLLGLCRHSADGRTFIVRVTVPTHYEQRATITILRCR